MKLSRREILTLGIAAGVSGAMANAEEDEVGKGGAMPKVESPAVPLVLCTDLYHPHVDPDDHWDLATAYALAKQGRVDLKAVVIDYPPLQGDPAIAAVAQMNHITGLSVPLAVGTKRKFTGSSETRAPGDQRDLHAAGLILRVLEESAEPVVIVITGSARDIAWAARRRPKLFAEKCRAVYLNAGMGTTDPAKGGNGDYNTLLDVAAFRAMFELPCTLYWLPVLETFINNTFQYEQFGTLWTFKQSEILSALAPEVQNYFLYMFRKNTAGRWLRCLQEPPDQEYLDEVGTWTRGMWCTAGFLHLAGLKVLADGSVVGLAEERDAIYSFEPVTVGLCENGVGEWHKNVDSNSRFIYENHDLEHLCSAMTRALRTILKVL